MTYNSTQLLRRRLETENNFDLNENSQLIIIKTLSTIQEISSNIGIPINNYLNTIATNNSIKVFINTTIQIIPTNITEILLNSVNENMKNAVLNGNFTSILRFNAIKSNVISMYYVIVNSSMIVNVNIEPILVTNNPTNVPTASPVIQLTQFANNQNKSLNVSSIIAIVVMCTFGIIIVIACIYFDLKTYFMQYFIHKNLNNKERIEIDSFKVQSSKQEKQLKEFNPDDLVDFDFGMPSEDVPDDTNVRNRITNTEIGEQSQMDDSFSEIVEKIATKHQKLDKMDNNKKVSIIVLATERQLMNKLTESYI